MNTLKVNPKANANVRGVPKLYFTSCNTDFFKYFNQICEDLFLCRSCSVYYTENMSTPNNRNEYEESISQMNAMVIPITNELLTTSNRVIGMDIKIADDYGIPILPIVMEDSIAYGNNYEIYNEIFKGMHFVSQSIDDRSLIPYIEKLKKYLDDIFIDDNIVKEIETDFSATVFLSYRKKDWCHVNKIRKIIHSNPACYDVAIWFDEYLIPGEEFSDKLCNMMSRSDMVALLVTPNLLEDNNYVIKEEYPYANKINKTIIPIEMATTDTKKLKRCFKKFPKVIKVGNYDKVSRKIGNTLKRDKYRCQKYTSEKSNKHNYLMGLAYIYGYYVERKIDLGIKLIKKSATAHYQPAVEYLISLYINGIGVPIDYSEALMWATSEAEYHRDLYSNNNRDTLFWMSEQALCLKKLGKIGEAIRLNEEIFICRRNLLQTESSDELENDFLTTCNNLCTCYIITGHFDKACSYGKMAYEGRNRLLEENDRQILYSLNNLATSYSQWKKYNEAIKLYEIAYNNCSKYYGSKDPESLYYLSNLRNALDSADDKNATESIKILREILDAFSKKFGKFHPDTLKVMQHLIYSLCRSGEFSEALIIGKELLETQKKVFDETNPDVLTSVGYLAACMSGLGNAKEAIDMYFNLFISRNKLFGDDNYQTQDALNNLLNCCAKFIRSVKSKQCKKQIQDIIDKVESMHPKYKEETLITLNAIKDYYHRCRH